MATIKKAQTSAKAKPLKVSRVRQIADSLDNVAGQKAQASINRTTKPGGTYDSVSKELNRQSKKDSDNATRYRKLADAAEKKKKMKNGGTVKNISAGPSKKSPIAPKVDPKGKFTKIQERTLGKMKSGGKMIKGKKC